MMGRRASRSTARRARCRWLQALLATVVGLAAADREYTPAEIALLDQAREQLTAERPAAALAVLETWSTAASPFRQILLGRCRDLLDDPDGAEQAYRLALELDPAMAEARQALLAFLHARGRYPAIHALTGILLHPETTPHAELALFADAAWRVEDRALCDLLAGIGLRRFPEEPVYRRLLLLRAMDDGDDHRALAYLRDALGREPDNRDLWLHLATLRRRQDDPAGERVALQAAVLLSPTDRAVRRQLLQALATAGMHAAALVQATAIMAGEDPPRDRDTVLLCAVAAQAAGIGTTAEAWLAALPVTDDDRDVLALRARILLDAGHGEAVETLLAAAIDRGLADPDLLLLAAVNALHLGRQAVAESRFRQVLASLPVEDARTVPAALGLAQMLLAHDAASEALELLRTAMAAHPRDASLEILLDHARARVVPAP